MSTPIQISNYEDYLNYLKKKTLRYTKKKRRSMKRKRKINKYKRRFLYWKRHNLVDLLIELLVMAIGVVVILWAFYRAIDFYIALQ